MHPSDHMFVCTLLGSSPSKIQVFLLLARQWPLLLRLQPLIQIYLAFLIRVRAIGFCFPILWWRAYWYMPSSYLWWPKSPSISIYRRKFGWYQAVSALSRWKGRPLERVHRYRGIHVQHMAVDFCRNGSVFQYYVPDRYWQSKRSGGYIWEIMIYLWWTSIIAGWGWEDVFALSVVFIGGRWRLGKEYGCTQKIIGMNLSLFFVIVARSISVVRLHKLCCEVCPSCCIIKFIWMWSYSFVFCIF